MSKNKEVLFLLRKKFGYEASVPRCATCKHYVSSHKFQALGGHRMLGPPMCRLGAFSVRMEACCDRWADKVNGTTLVAERAA